MKRLILSSKKIRSNILAANDTHNDQYISDQIEKFVSSTYMDSILKGLRQSASDQNPTFADMIIPYITEDNIIIVTYHYPYMNGQILNTDVLLKIPEEVGYACTINYEYREYLKYLPKLESYVESTKPSNQFVYNIVRSAGIAGIGLFDTEDDEDIVSRLKDVISRKFNHFNLWSSFYMSIPKNGQESRSTISLPGMRDFINWCKTSKKSTSNKTRIIWKNIVNQLNSEAEDGVDSIYEQTDAGVTIDNIAKGVEDLLNIDSEVSIQGGNGSIYFYSKDTGEELSEIDYQEFCDDIISLAMESSSKKEFVSKLKSYYDYYLS